MSGHKKINLSTNQSLGFQTDTIEVRSINLAPDDSGTWEIEVAFKSTHPTRGSDPTVTINERHLITGKVSVTRAEIAASQGLPEAAVRGTLTLEQTETAVTNIAMGKLLAVMGLTA